jgi:aspartyl-tRNA(Asn)/glutamyl-tRNA(Gln) amidotransferase subunit A
VAELGPDVLFASVRELGALLRQRQISSVELTRAYLHRLETIGPKLGAVATVTRERALAEAQKADAELARPRGARGPLLGIPYGAKDLLATRGIPTTWGAEPLRGQVFDYDATVIERLRAAGAVLVAKLAMVELAGGMGYNNPDASWTGPGRTPWNPGYWSGGSSSGSGAATAAGLVAFAIGSETSGSILTPATFCGLSGLRPTYGRVSRHGAMALCWTLDKLGPMCRAADDCGLVLAAMAGADARDPTTVEEPFTWTPPARPAKKWRVGVLRHATTGAQPEVKATFEKSLEVLGGFCALEADVEFPDLPWGPAVGIIVDAEGASAFREFIEGGGTRKLRAVADRVGAYSAIMTLAVDYLQAMRARVPMRRELDALLSRYDAVVVPTRTRVTYPIGHDFDKPPGPVPAPTPTPAPGAPRPPAAPATIPAGNLAGVPALCVPNGVGAEGIPTSLQFLGRAFSERTLLDIAYRYQQATDWHRRRPAPTA